MGTSRGQSVFEKGSGHFWRGPVIGAIPVSMLVRLGQISYGRHRCCFRECRVPVPVYCYRCISLSCRRPKFLHYFSFHKVSVVSRSEMLAEKETELRCMF